MSNKDYFEYLAVQIATALAESQLSPAEFIKNTGNNPNNTAICLLCRIILELQSKNVVVLNILLVKIEKSYPSLAKEGSQDGWELTYNNYLQKIKNEDIRKGLEIFDIFLNEAESFGT